MIWRDKSSGFVSDREAHAIEEKRHKRSGKEDQFRRRAIPRDKSLGIVPITTEKVQRVPDDGAYWQRY